MVALKLKRSLEQTTVIRIHFRNYYAESAPSFVAVLLLAFFAAAAAAHERAAASMPLPELTAAMADRELDRGFDDCDCCEPPEIIAAASLTVCSAAATIAVFICGEAVRSRHTRCCSSSCC